MLQINICTVYCVIVQLFNVPLCLLREATKTYFLVEIISFIKLLLYLNKCRFWMLTKTGSRFELFQNTDPVQAKIRIRIRNPDLLRTKVQLAMPTEVQHDRLRPNSCNLYMLYCPDFLRSVCIQFGIKSSSQDP